MLGIIQRILHILSGAITDAEKWVLKLIHAVYSYVNKLFYDLRKAVTDVWRSLVRFSRAIEKYAVRVYMFARWIVTKYVPAVIHWTLRELNTLLNDIKSLASWAEKWVIRLYNDILSAIRSITGWVIAHIWTPLFNAITIAWHWITHEGYYVWNLLTHPDLLMKVIGSYLWMNSLALLKHYARPIAKWLVHQMLNMQGEIADVLESIIANML